MQINEAENAANENRIGRYRLLLVARQITSGHGVTGCMLHMVNLAEPVEVTFSEIKRRANLRNVQTCKSVWACPVCADRITRFRAAELMQAMDGWAAAGNTAALATYTISHGPAENCRAVLDRLMLAYNNFKRGRSYQRLKSESEVAASVRALEVTYGANGWHWHIHEIYLLKGARPDRFGPMLREMRRHWLKSVEAAGGKAVAKGFDLKREKRAAFDYIAKFGKGDKNATWNAAREIVRAPAKNMNRDGRGLHPFGVLSNGETSAADRAAWNEYVKATKGVRQLRYSAGAKELLGIGEVSDEAIVAAEAAEADRIMARLAAANWYRLNVESRAVLSEFWMIANTGDVELLAAWLDDHDIVQVIDKSTD